MGRGRLGEGTEREEHHEEDRVEEGSNRVGGRARPCQARETSDTLEKASAGSTRKASTKAEKIRGKMMTHLKLMMKKPTGWMSRVILAARMTASEEPLTLSVM